MKEEVQVLPFTELKNKTWTFLHGVYNIKIVRDIFVYCALKEKISKNELYEVMDQNIIPPPTTRWVYPKRKKRDRLKDEYVHSTRYLGFIKLEDNFFMPDFSGSTKEKEIILKENKNRDFKPTKTSKSFTEKEKEAMLKIILNYERARDFLRWFLDFSKYPTIWSFDETDFRHNALPIHILSIIKKGKKAREILKRESDGKVWKIPNDYTRLASFVLPKWFKEFGLIDRIIVFSEFSFDKNTWYMYYPTKTGKFLTEDNIKDEILNIFKEEKLKKTIWIPYLLYRLARRFYYPLDKIKDLLISLYGKDEKIVLERTSLQVMKYAGKVRRYSSYRDSFIKIDGIYRSYMMLLR